MEMGTAVVTVTVTSMAAIGMDLETETEGMVAIGGIITEITLATVATIANLEDVAVEVTGALEEEMRARI